MLPALKKRANRALELQRIHQLTNASFRKPPGIMHMQTARGYRPDFSTESSNAMSAFTRECGGKTPPARVRALPGARAINGHKIMELEQTPSPRSPSLTRIDSKVWRAYGWHGFTVGQVCHVSRCLYVA
jgi:hypothetical protein